MGAGLQVELGPPQHGSLVVTLRTDEQELVLLASYVPFDSLKELAGALVALLEWQSNGIARFNCEPEGYDLRFGRGVSADRTLGSGRAFPLRSSSTGITDDRALVRGLDDAGGAVLLARVPEA